MIHEVGPPVFGEDDRQMTGSVVRTGVGNIYSADSSIGHERTEDRCSIWSQDREPIVIISKLAKVVRIWTSCPILDYGCIVDHSRFQY